MSEPKGKYEVTVSLSAAEVEAARIEREHAARQGHCVCVLCEDQRMLRVEREAAKLRRIEQTAKELCAATDERFALGPLRAALEGKT